MIIVILQTNIKTGIGYRLPVCLDVLPPKVGKLLRDFGRGYLLLINENIILINRGKGHNIKINKIEIHSHNRNSLLHLFSESKWNKKTVDFFSRVLSFFF